MARDLGQSSANPILQGFRAGRHEDAGQNSPSALRVVSFSQVYLVDTGRCCHRRLRCRHSIADYIRNHAALAIADRFSGACRRSAPSRVKMEERLVAYPPSRLGVRRRNTRLCPTLSTLRHCGDSSRSWHARDTLFMPLKYPRPGRNVAASSIMA
jgi:hypothetical protein